MLIDSKQIVSMTEANQNFSKVVRQAEEDGCVVIFKNNKPKYVLLDVEAMRIPISDSDDKLERAARKEVSRAKWL
ncbi:MAG: type II toxin-antitoxin system Phd/YefM family antitoxin [Corallococcus sp.]|nr:type II toxin-antitoxin system Phd/YefM family antitoxin [Corallococcus sp.]